MSVHSIYPLMGHVNDLYLLDIDLISLTMNLTILSSMKTLTENGQSIFVVNTYEERNFTSSATASQLKKY